ncbi:MAG: LysR family transcriptional regulator [Microbacterium sp.]|uniref:LysR family transcriptional regulator n=1 Tax=Microbacterium sp. TaxID=51671 RepID=UPI0039E3FB82
MTHDEPSRAREQVGAGRKIDANLLVVLDALLTERSTTTAARRLHASESSVTSSLRRLRQQLGDQLLVRGSGGMVLTPAAVELQETTRAAMAAVARAMEGGPQFDAAVSRRTFWISVSESTQSQIGGHLARFVRRSAPGVRLRFDSFSSDGFTLDSLFRRDVVLAHAGSGIAGARRPLFEDALVPVVAATNPLLQGDRIADADVARMRLVIATGGRSIPEPVERMFAAVGLPRIGLNVIGDYGVPQAVAGTDMIGIVPRRRAESVLEQLDLVIPATSLADVRIQEAAFWHPSKKLDPAITWLVGQIEKSVTAAGLTSLAG